MNKAEVDRRSIDQEHVLFALCACTKVAARTPFKKRTTEFQQDMSKRLDWIAGEADRLKIYGRFKTRSITGRSRIHGRYNSINIKRAMQALKI